MIGSRLRILVTVGRQRPIEAVSAVMRANTDWGRVEPDRSIPEEFRFVKDPFSVVRGRTFGEVTLNYGEG